MAFDTLIKKFFPGIIAVVIAMIAYLQASGVVQLVTGAALAVDPEQLVAGSLGQQVRPSVASSTRTRSARKLIDHNVFDHETDLNPKPPPPPEPDVGDLEQKAGAGKLDLSDPLGAPQCEGVSVNIITESNDPTWSVAIIKAPDEDAAALRRVGDVAGDFEVAYIGFNRVEASPAVWLVKESKLCQALLFAEEPPPAPKNAKASPKEDDKPTPPAPKTRGAPSVPKEIADKIEKISATEFNVDRAVVDSVLENQAELMRSARIVPEKGADGKTVGIRLFGLRPDTLLGTLGLENGDRLETINGFNLSSPEEALNAYARLRTANKLAVKLTRRGKPTTIDLNIK